MFSRDLGGLTAANDLDAMGNFERVLCCRNRPCSWDDKYLTGATPIYNWNREEGGGFDDTDWIPQAYQSWQSALL